MGIALANALHLQRLFPALTGLQSIPIFASFESDEARASLISL
jgi:hypothetical protein